MSIKFEPGRVYDVAHLRPFDLELALAGHPICTPSGYSARLFRALYNQKYSYDYWTGKGWMLSGEQCDGSALLNLRLAPLAVKDGRALHVGDEIKVFGSTWMRWARVTLDFYNWVKVLHLQVTMQWRWPEGKE
jgi:hypothetical protein